GLVEHHFPREHSGRTLWGRIGRRRMGARRRRGAVTLAAAVTATRRTAHPEVRMKKLLLQLDSDRNPSAFDRIVAYDAGADEVLSYGGVTAADVASLVHGAMFTRGPADLRHTAMWVGGSDVSAAESVFATLQKTFFGPFRVSAMMDANGCNTTA